MFRKIKAFFTRMRFYSTDIISYLRSLTWVGWLNWVLFQWFFVRLMYSCNEVGGRKFDFQFIGLIWPLTGWFSQYKILKKVTFKKKWRSSHD